MRRIVFLYLLLAVLLGTLIISLFKNISYPLMWGDEAETALYAERIITFGYPKVHNGNNSLNLAMISGEGVGVKEEYDAHIVSLWGQYYYAVPGVYLARFVDDIFIKTAIIRIPFAFVGLMGVLILPFSIFFLFKKDKSAALPVYIVYIIFQLISVSLVLHLREVRSYSLAVFFSSLILIIFCKYYFHKPSSYYKYVVLMTICLLLLLNCFPPAFLPSIFGIGSYVLIDAFLKNYSKRKPGIQYFKIVKQNVFPYVLPLLFSVIIAIPILIFFETSNTSLHSYQDISYSISIYFVYLSRVIKFLGIYHFLALGILLKAVSIFLYKRYRKEIDVVKDKNGLVDAMRVSNFLFYFFLSYVFLVVLTPYLFDRYFIFLQPLLSLIIVLDFYINIKLIVQLNYKKVERDNILTLFVLATIMVFTLSLATKIDSIIGHVYEITNRYTGPIDVIVSYIEDNFNDTESLKIDTNIEQTSYIYYLGSRVICDEVMDCGDEAPDIIIPRRYSLSEKFVEDTLKFLELKKYEKITLPILDYPSNNIPEFSLSLRHLFKTPATDNEEEKVILYVLKSD